MDKTPRYIDLLIYDDANIVDIAGPAQVFSSALRDDTPAYSVRYVSTNGQPVRSSCGLCLMADAPLSPDSMADDLLIPGGNGTDHMLGDETTLNIIGNWQSTRPHGRLISVCSGALILAGAGMLDGRRATTHWNRKGQAHRLFPAVDWQIGQLYFADPPVMTSAGVASGIDLALAVVRRDCGAASALTVAREMVVYLQRAGGQSQFADILEAQFCADTGLQKLLDQIVQSPQHEWTLNSMADVAGMTPRTLSRRFVKEAGVAPAQFLERLRVKRASDIIAAGSTAAKAIGLAGFSNYQHMQRAFKRQLNVTIGAYEARFRSPILDRQENLDGTSAPN